MSSALFFTVPLLVVATYFFMSSMPLLTLKHDSPQDARFIRGFFYTNYSIVLFTAGATATAYAVVGWLPFAAGAAGIALTAFTLRRFVIPKMDSLHAKIQLNEKSAISSFRRTHVLAILTNLAQFLLILWSLVATSLQMK